MNLALSFAFLLQLAFLLGITVWLPVASTAQVQLLANLFPAVSGRLLTLAQGCFRLVIIGVALRFYKDRLKQNLPAAACLSLPVLAAWLLLKSFLPSILSDPLVIAIVTVASGAILLVVCKEAGNRATLDMRSFFAAGCTGILALIPGVGIMTALVCGLTAAGQSEKNAYPMAVLGSVPVLAVQTLEQFGRADFSQLLTPMVALSVLFGMVLSGLMAWVVLRGMTLWLKKHTFKPVAVVRTGFGIFLLLLYGIF